MMNIKTDTLPNGKIQILITDSRKGTTKKYLLETDAEASELIRNESARHIAQREKESQEMDATTYRNLFN